MICEDFQGVSLLLKHGTGNETEENGKWNGKLRIPNEV